MILISCFTKALYKRNYLHVSRGKKGTDVQVNPPASPWQGRGDDKSSKDNFCLCTYVHESWNFGELIPGHKKASR